MFSPTARFFVRGVGVLLLVAALLKLAAGGEVSAVARSGLLARPGMNGAMVAVETLLGLWFVSGVGVRAARWAALGLFATFAIASGVAGVEGAASCGCMGAAQVSPWAVMVFDILVVLLLVVLRFGGPWQPADRAAARIAGGTAAVAAVTAAGLVAWFGSWSVAWAAFKDQPLAVDPAAVSVGNCRAGEPAEAAVTFTNLTREPLQVILVQSDCSCVTADVPAWVGPGESRPVRVVVRPPKDAGPFVRKVGWLTTAGTWPGEVRGVVVGPSP